MLTEYKQLDITKKILIISIMTYFFLLLIMPHNTFILTLALLMVDLLFLATKKNMKMKINFNTIIFGFFVLISLLGILVGGIYIGGAFIHVLTLATIWLNYVLLTSFDGWQPIFLKSLFFIGIFFILGSIIQIISPSLIVSLNRILLADHLFTLSYNQITWADSLVGFTHNTAINGYVLSVLSLWVANIFLLTKDKRTKILSLIAFLLLYYLLFLTGKRGFIIFSVLIILYLIFVNTNIKLYAILLSIVAILFLYLLVSNTDIGREILERTFETDDVTSGRTDIYKIMWEDIKSKPFWGSGTFTTQNIATVNHGHNVYLQVLRENGIFGFLCLISLLLYNSIKTHRLIIKTKNYSEKYLLGLSQVFQLLFIMWSFTGNPLYDTYPLLLYIVGIALTRQVYIKKLYLR